MRQVRIWRAFPLPPPPVTKGGPKEGKRKGKEGNEGRKKEKEEKWNSEGGK